MTSRRYSFVSANSPAGLAANIARLSADDGALDLTEYKGASQDDQYAAVIRWLQQNKGWLLILDNVDTKEAVAAVQKLVAKLTSGHVIVTSRITAWGGGIPRIPLGVLSADAAVALLIDKANSLPRTPRPDDARQARLLAEQLGYLPLALTHAAAYVGESDLTFEAYLKEFDQALQYHEEEVIEYDSNPENAKILKTVATTYFLSIDRLGPVEKAMLRAASFLAPAPIPIAMFADCPDETKALVDLWCEETGEPIAEKSVRDAVTELVRYSLIDRDGDGFTIHRMERLVLSHKVPKDRVPKWIEGARAALLRYAPDETGESPTTWPVWERLRPHAETLVECGRSDDGVKPRLALMGALGALYYGKGLYDLDLRMEEKALAVARRTPALDVGDLANRLLGYGEALHQLGRNEEAEAAFTESLGIREKADGPNSLRVAECLNYLAMAAGEKGRVEHSEALQRRALAIYDANPQDADPHSVIKTQSNLASLLFFKGDHASAATMYRRALAECEKVLGRDHPHTLVNVNNLAVVLDGDKNYAAAEPLFMRALEARERVLGPGHPDTLRTLHHLAAMLAKAGRPDESAALGKQYIARMATTEGSVVPIALRQLAFECYRDGDYVRAEQLLRRVLEAHFEVPGTYCLLARILLLMDRDKEASSEVEKALESRADWQSYTGQRVYFFHVVFALLSGNSPAEALQNLKRELERPDAMMDWDLRRLLDHLKPRLTPEADGLLEALSAAINDRAAVNHLETLPAWKAIL
jgi:tetratricopeptide (TPR) repeat protein